MPVGARPLLHLEDPRRLEPAEREVHVETLLESGLLLHGYIDRVDVAPDGAIRVVDYKTGRSPGEMFEAKALFQMKFYALVVWRTRGVIPGCCSWSTSATARCCATSPTSATCSPPSARSRPSGQAIQRAQETGDWRPNRSRLCDWCDHQAICPAWGGTPPPLPERDVPSLGAGSCRRARLSAAQ